MPEMPVPQGDWFFEVNRFAWIMSNILVGYIGVVLVIFVIGYFLLFDPRATTGGRLIFNFSVSIAFVIGLVFIGIFVDPQPGRDWFIYLGDQAGWRPLVRLVAYGFVAFTITHLTVLLALRKWRPKSIKTADSRPNEDTLVKIRTRKK